MADGISTSYVEVQSLRAFLARPDSGDGGAGMLLLPMITGIGEQVREFASDIARTGVTALSWDPFHGPSSDDTPHEKLFEYLSQLDDETALSEQKQLLDYLFDTVGLQRVGTIGWCLGGRFALLLGGSERRLSNVVAYHPTVPATPAPNHTLDVPEHCAEIEAPVMMLYPEADDLVPRESFDAMQKALLSRDSGPSVIHFYPGAEHGFSARARHSNPVNADASELAWPQALAFIKTTTRSR